MAWYQLTLKNEFDREEVIPIEKDDDDMAYARAKQIVYERNAGSVRLKSAMLFRLEHIWTATFKTDPDF
ncbi:hypothetical protein HYV30_00275 [Candidatus Kaiserbacteria bacterium]|nr:hypothetical protein [Candidatus Kaiserbacteria bacterium]